MCIRDRIEVSVSHTTRPQRPGEEDGKNYFFVSETTFLSLRENGAFFEWAEVFGHHYGTGIAQLEARLAQGADVVLEIDWQGAQQVRESMPECISVFILPPSQKALKERLFSRDTDTKEIIAQRLNEAYEDMTHWNEFDYCIINDNFETAAAELEAIFNDEGAISLTDNPALIKKINKILM